MTYDLKYLSLTNKNIKRMNYMGKIIIISKYLYIFLYENRAKTKKYGKWTTF